MSLLKVYQKNYGEEALKSEIQEIVRSYRHSWDIFSELIQNSVDAINRRHYIHNDPSYYLYDEFRSKYGNIIEPEPEYKGEINIEWDTNTYTLTISDNGIGIEKDKIERYLLPKGSGKKIGVDYGFKGYGLTFAAFVSKVIDIKTKFIVEDNIYRLQLNNCFDWLARDGDFPDGPIKEPQVIINDDNNGMFIGTSISIQLDDNYSKYFPAVAS